jgi:hypothetical protein
MRARFGVPPGEQVFSAGGNLVPVRIEENMLTHVELVVTGESPASGGAPGRITVALPTIVHDPMPVTPVR